MIFLAFAAYTIWVDAGPIGMPSPARAPSAREMPKGNCSTKNIIAKRATKSTALGGYIGPDLTNVYSTPGKGPAYILRRCSRTAPGACRIFTWTIARSSRSWHIYDRVDASGSSPLEPLSHDVVRDA